ncbi:hypothetical protein HPB47_027777 [Ixodes persulcatus]|uniref:Uncharacterized protein n=1 Tax=Ixodes persulcatus TaxID=34615 RepID=A0AC60PV15_IXOPE|nr:hypothetical protein HPB47_027777 [Ixodes persulcatus]
MGFQGLGRIPGVIGCVDGTMIAIVGPSQNDPTVCDADCRVMSIAPRSPGSVHDSFAWRYSWLRSNFEQGRLIDDGRCLLVLHNICLSSREPNRSQTLTLTSQG